MIHPHTEIRYINDAIGYGVVATKFIPKGTITWVLDKLDRTFTQQEVESLDPLYQRIIETYTYRNRNGHHVLCWDNGRFVNHSFRSNCLTTAYDFEIAIRDIQPGEELTDDYGYLNITEPFEAASEDGTDRKMVYPDDLIRLHPFWDQQLEDAFPSLTKVEQPLFHILPEDTKMIALQVADGKMRMHSILSCYYDPHHQSA